MVDLSRIGQSLANDPLIAAQAAQAAGKTNKTEKKQKPLRTRGLGLSDIPEESPYVDVENVEISEEKEVNQAEESQTINVLEKIDAELAELQDLIKKVLARKIKLADRHEEHKHDLLVSAFNDCKNAYVKVKEVRDTIAS